jgi:hypothetical protein
MAKKTISKKVKDHLHKSRVSDLLLHTNHWHLSPFKTWAGDREWHNAQKLISQWHFLFQIQFYKSINRRHHLTCMHETWFKLSNFKSKVSNRISVITVCLLHGHKYSVIHHTCFVLFSNKSPFLISSPMQTVKPIILLHLKPRIRMVIAVKGQITNPWLQKMVKDMLVFCQTQATCIYMLL